MNRIIFNWFVFVIGTFAADSFAVAQQPPPSRGRAEVEAVLPAGGADSGRGSSEGKVIEPPVVESVDDTVYADRPYWYKPGHPLNPAESSTIQTLPGFQAERVFTVPADGGSITALAIDPQGRLLAATQHEAGLYRISPSAPGDTKAATKVERLGGAAARIGWSHGLLYAFDSLYVTVAETNDAAKTGIHRLRDTDGDGQFDEVHLLFELKGSGEHGPHNLVVGPDSKSLYLMGGNGTQLPAGVKVRRPTATTGIERLMPPGFENERGKHSIEGWVLRFDPDGGRRELIVSGLRNSYDLAFNRRGDLFAFDSDMEWDLGAPWYRPTRICHLVSGGEYGWREDSAMWPEQFEDNVPPVVNIGPASPTGVVFGYGTKFPEKYQRALFACDWTFATIHAVHLRPHGASYRADVEEFVGGSGLPVTDVVVGRDGALYFAVGGRQLGSAIYRVRYVGEEGGASANPAADEFSPEDEQLHALRRELESKQGIENPSTVKSVWPYLGHTDRAIRFAARVALEAQPVTNWRDQALAEKNLQASLTALLALARQGVPEDQAHVLAQLNTVPWDALTAAQRHCVVRIYELALARGKEAVRGGRADAAQFLRARYPSNDVLLDRELARLLCFLRDSTMIEPLLERMAADKGDRPLLGSGNFVRNPKYGAAVSDMLQSAPLMERMHDAQMLLWLDDGWTLEERRRFFALIADAVANSRGGHQYQEFWGLIRQTALAQISEDQREEFASIQPPPRALEVGVPVAKGPGRAWTMGEALAVVGRGLNGRDLQRGRDMYAAARCSLCHRMNGEGGATGPDLSTVGKRFTVRDILDATIHPSKAISDQYQVMTLELEDGRILSGRVVSRDDQSMRIATDLMRPMEATTVPGSSILRIRAELVSTMPSGLLNVLNEEELLDLIAYLKAGDQ